MVNDSIPTSGSSRILAKWQKRETGARFPRACGRDFRAALLPRNPWKTSAGCTFHLQSREQREIIIDAEISLASFAQYFARRNCNAAITGEFGFFDKSVITGYWLRSSNLMGWNKFFRRLLSRKSFRLNALLYFALGIHILCEFCYA